MENREKITWRIWESEGFARSLLIGGLLSYIPIINLLLLGYYGLWARRLLRREGMQLPEWRDGRAIFEELGRVILPAIVWIFLPVFFAILLGSGFTGLLFFLHLGFFGATLAWLPLSLAALFSPVAMTLALIRINEQDSVRAAFDLEPVIRGTLRNLRRCLFPLLQYYGLLAIGWPLIGFASFAAMLPLLAQLILVLRQRDEA